MKKENRVREAVFEIYFSDLNPKAQKDLLKFYNIKNPCQMNFDIYPVATLPKQTCDS